MRIRLVCLEDGIISCGFRKMAAWVKGLHPETEAYYVSTNSWASMSGLLRGRRGDRGELPPDAIDEIAQELAGADLIGFSSMTGYADLTKAIIRRVREISPQTFLIWGGIHPIIHPEDAIEADVDAICTGEGEFAFREFFERWKSAADYTETRNFWFKRGGEVIRNGFIPLMSGDDMETLPFPQYGEAESIYKQGRGFVPLALGDYLESNGLAYNAIWTIGCPFHCSFCGNTKFIANDRNYRKLRHPSASYIVEEVKQARRRFPHISSVSFHDDSIMAIPFRELEKFAELWRAELGLPFAVFGVIPNYVKRDKYELLTWARMNRIRMGIQSGSKRVLEFYRRPTPIEKVEEAAEVSASFSPRYHVAPAYDLIVDNPIETRDDVIDTLELLYRMARPYTLNVYSLKVIPNTSMEEEMKKAGVDIEEISSNYLAIPPRWGNAMIYLLGLWRPPRWLFERLLGPVRASSTPQRHYPVIAFSLRALFYVKRGLGHLRFMEFSSISGWTGYVFWRLGIIRAWRRFLNRRPPRPDRRGSFAAVPALDETVASTRIA